MSWTPETALAIALILPLIGGVGVAALGRFPNLREACTLVTAVILAIVVAYLVEMAPQNPEITLIEFAPGLTLSFKLEPLGAVFAMVASGLWIINSLYSIGYMRGNKEKDQTRFYVCFTIAIASAMGIALAGNLLTLFFFYEALTLSTFPLVAHKGDAKARKGARIYLGILLATSIGLLLPAVFTVWYYAGTTSFEAGGILADTPVGITIGGILLFMFAFGIGKAALMPIHPWLPNAMVAPTPVSALLHAVAVVKAGVFTMLKVTTYTFGPDFMQSLPAADALAWIAGISIVVASVIAMTKDNLKARLAYSTVSQLSYITLGAMLAAPIAMLGGAIQIIMHAFGKITLFMGAGTIYTATKKTEISQLDGLGRLMPVTFIAFTLGALSIIGLPPFGGVWPKLFLMEGAAIAGQPWLIAVLIGSSILNIGYLLPITFRGFFKPAPETNPVRPGLPPVLAVVAPVITAVGTIALFFLIGPLVDYLSPVFTTEMRP